MRNSLFNGLTEVCTIVGNMRNIPSVPCMGTPTHYGICSYTCKIIHCCGYHNYSQAFRLSRQWLSRGYKVTVLESYFNKSCSQEYDNCLPYKQEIESGLFL